LSPLYLRLRISSHSPLFHIRLCLAAPLITGRVTPIAEYTSGLQFNIFSTYTGAMIFCKLNTFILYVTNFDYVPTLEILYRRSYNPWLLSQSSSFLSKRFCFWWFLWPTKDGRPRCKIHQLCFILRFREWEVSTHFSLNPSKISSHEIEGIRASAHILTCWSQLGVKEPHSREGNLPPFYDRSLRISSWFTVEADHSVCLWTFGFSLQLKGPSGPLVVGEEFALR
jgi:hypothetical protein